MFFVAGHQEISASGACAFQDAVILVMCNNARECEGWSDDRGEGVNFRYRFADLGFCPTESMSEY